MSTCMLSTFDNPFDPFEQFSSWMLFDKEKGYNSCERLNRIATYTDDMTQKEVDEETERAIDEIIKYDVLNVYTKVSASKSNNTQESKPVEDQTT